MERVCVVAQTTQTTDDYALVVDKIKSYYPDALVFNTICSSTQERQAEVVSLANDMDSIFIVGGRNSANTKRLADLARRTKTPTFHIETATEIESIDLRVFTVTIGVSAGASTPNWIIDRVMDKITSGQRAKSKATGFLMKLWVTSIKADIYSAVGAGCLCAAAVLLQKRTVLITDVAIAAFFVYGMHVLNRLISRRPASFIGSFREETYLRYRKTLPQRGYSFHCCRFGTGFYEWFSLFCFSFSYVCRRRAV